MYIKRICVRLAVKKFDHNCSSKILHKIQFHKHARCRLSRDTDTGNGEDDLLV